MIVKDDRIFAQEYKRQRMSDLEQIQFELSVHEQMIHDIAADVQKYIKEHYNGEEEIV